MVWFDGEQRAANRHHAVPGSIRLKVVFFGIRHGMRHLEGAEVGNIGPGAVRMDTNDSIVRAGQTMRTPCASDERIEFVVDELDIRHTADKISESVTGGAGGQTLGNGGDSSGAYVHFGDAGRESAGVRAGTRGRAGSLVTQSDGGKVSPGAAFGDVEIAVRTEGEPSRIVEPGCDYLLCHQRQDGGDEQQKSRDY